jgi:hypothetical protein
LHRIVIHTTQLLVAVFFIPLQNNLAFEILSYAVADSVYELGLVLPESAHLSVEILPYRICFLDKPHQGTACGSAQQKIG